MSSISGVQEMIYDFACCKRDEIDKLQHCLYFIIGHVYDTEENAFIEPLPGVYDVPGLATPSSSDDESDE